MTDHPNVDAVEKAVTASKLTTSPVYAPLVELVRTLARQMDACGDEGPSARLAGAYLSALKDLNRATVVRPVPVVEDELAKFKKRIRRTS